MNQVQQYIDKISKLLKETPNTVPYPLQCFYTLIKTATLELKEKDVSLQLVGNFSNIYKFLKKWLEQPIPDPRDRNQIFPELKKFLIPFRKYLPKDDVTRAFLRNFQDDQNHKKVREMRQRSDKICKQSEAKNNIVHISANTDIAISFWVNSFKADYAVHFSIFWDSFMQLTKQLSYYQKFISDSSKKTIKQIMDPQSKFFVGMAVTNEFFHKLTEPTLLRILAEQTAKGSKQPAFESKRSIQLKFTAKQQGINTKLTNQDILIISGEQVAVNGQIIKCRFPQTIRFGSSQDSEVMVKHKFISRRQFMLVEEEQGFSIICISPSNFTCIMSKDAIELVPGRLFKVGDDIIQVLKIGIQFANVLDDLHGTNKSSYSLTQYETTLEYLPENESIKAQKMLEYKILTGAKKDQKRTLQGQKLTIETPTGQLKLNYQLSNFYLPPYTPFLLKNANQVLSGHLSDKCLLQKGMKIALQQCQFTVL